ncbi:MAG: hypothetical protein WD696_10245 [Bryobacteraceae bacterium]
MRRKLQPKPEEVVSKQILEQARHAAVADRLNLKASKCTVCETTLAPSESRDLAAAQSGETLCWVCRRLKISAWRESVAQMPAQE